MCSILAYGAAITGGTVWRKYKQDVIAMGIIASCGITIGSNISGFTLPLCACFKYCTDASFQEKFALKTSIGYTTPDRLLAVSYLTFNTYKIIFKIMYDFGQTL